jgi:hypothetical protein
MSLRTTIGGLLAAAALLLVLLVPENAHAQTVSPTPNRDQTWETVTSITMVAGAATELLMPRLFYSDPEVTAGWKARWHVSVLAPAMTLVGASLLNEYALKGAFKGMRPGCDDSNAGFAHCDTYGMVSTHTFAAGSALGNGTAVFLVDTLKWSGGRVSGASILGNIAAPLVLGVVTGVGRGVGNWETPGQVVVGGVGGIVVGAITGLTYSLMQRPECGYSGSLICW